VFFYFFISQGMLLLVICLTLSHAALYLGKNGRVNDCPEGGGDRPQDWRRTLFVRFSSGKVPVSTFVRTESRDRAAWLRAQQTVEGAQNNGCCFAYDESQDTILQGINKSQTSPWLF
jgi:hypothetical protein